jgi:hypothetical protein
MLLSELSRFHKIRSFKVLIRFKSPLVLLVLLLFSAVTLAETGAANLKVLSLNAWMLKLPIVRISISKENGERTKILPGAIAETGADIVVFQEMWIGDVRNKIVKAMKALGYPYAAARSKKFNIKPLRGIMGNGLLIVSKFPLDTKTELLRFQKRTRADEYFASKGAIKTRAQIPEVGLVDLYASHLGAVSYEPKLGTYNPKQEESKSHQAGQLVQWIGKTRTEEIQILGVDLNSHYRSMESGVFTRVPSFVYTFFADPIQGLGLIDTFRELNGFPPAGTLNSPDCTYCMDNVYAATGLFGNAPSEVEDYVFINRNNRLIPTDSVRVFTEDLSGQADELRAAHELKKVPKHLSDHYGVLTTFKIQ